MSFKENCGIHFFIDYENVGNSGLEGVQYLENADMVSIFYSKSCEGIQKKYIENIVKRAGNFEAIRLKEVRKNGLDFYIAISIGGVIMELPEAKVAIIAKDGGYYSILDYCNEYTDRRNITCLSSSIENAILTLDEKSERKKEIENSRRRLSIGEQYEVYRDRKNLYDNISSKLYGSEYIGEMDRVFGIVTANPSLKGLYLEALREFGVKKGQGIYRIIKGAIEE